MCLTLKTPCTLTREVAFNLASKRRSTWGINFLSPNYISITSEEDQLVDPSLILLKLWDGCSSLSPQQDEDHEIFGILHFFYFYIGDYKGKKGSI